MILTSEDRQHGIVVLAYRVHRRRPVWKVRRTRWPSIARDYATEPLRIGALQQRDRASERPADKLRAPKATVSFIGLFGGILPRPGLAVQSALAATTRAAANHQVSRSL